MFHSSRIFPDEGSDSSNRYVVLTKRKVNQSLFTLYWHTDIR